MTDPMGTLSGDVFAHLLDDAVAVQVVGTVFVSDAVAVAVHRHVAGAGAGAGFVEEIIPPVRIHARHEVEHALVH